MIIPGNISASNLITWESSNYWIYTYWNYYPWTSKSLVQNYSLSTNEFTAHCHEATNSYFACNDNKVYTILHNNPPTAFATTWYICTLMYEAGVWEDLELDKIKISHITNWWSVKIYARTSDTASYTLIKTIDNTTAKKTYISVNEIIQAGVSLWTFNEIQFKIELTRWATVTNNPKVKRFTSWFNITNNF